MFTSVSGLSVVVTGGTRGIGNGIDGLTGDPGGLVRGEQEDAPGDVGGLGRAVDYLTAEAGIHDGLREPFGHRAA